MVNDRVTLPSGIGPDFSGFVEELGEGVTRFELGQAVVGTAPFASLADFVVVDMFANYCTGREDVKGAMAGAERQLKRLYRT